MKTPEQIWRGRAERTEQKIARLEAEIAANPHDATLHKRLSRARNKRRTVTRMLTAQETQ